MKVRMLVSIVGPMVDARPGDEREFSDDEAQRLISSGQAEPCPPKAETASFGGPPQRGRRIVPVRDR
jgi:hypothetical protein